MRHLPASPLERQLGRPNAVASEHIDRQRHDVNTDTTEDVKLYLDILRRRKWCVIVPLFFIVPLAILVIATGKPQYTSKSRVLIEKDPPQVLATIQDINRNNDPSDNFFSTEYSLIMSQDNLAEVVNLLQLDKKPLVQDPFLIQVLNTVLAWPKTVIRQLKNQVMALINSATGGTLDVPQVVISPDEQRRMAAVNALLLATQVTPVGEARLVDVFVTGDDPREVTQVVNTLVDVYVRKNMVKRLETSHKAIEWLTNKTADLRDKTQAAEQALQNFREKKNLVTFDLEGRRNIIQERLVSLYNAFTQANTTRLDLEPRLNKVKSLTADNIESIEALSAIGDNTIIKHLRQVYIDSVTQYKNAAETFTPKHPKMVQMQVQIDETKRAINQELQKMAGALQTEYNILRSKEASLTKELNSQKDNTLGLNNDMITYAALQRDADNQRTLYTEASKRLEEIKLTEASITNNVKIVESGTIPLMPVPSKDMLILFGSVFAGGVFGVGLAFIKEYLANRFRSADEIEHYLRIPFLGVIPRFAVSKRRRGQPITLQAPMSPAAEAYRLLRTRLFPSLLGMKTLLVTSAVPAEGKSTTTANLGVSFAQLGLKVLVVDVDLRRPSMHRHFHLPKDCGLTSVLTQEADWPSVLCETAMPNLKVLPTGPLPHNPSDLLCLGSLRQLFDRITREFDLVLVDVPLTLSLPDVEILAPDMDGVLLVHDPVQCDRKKVLEARKRLERVHANILGIVLNNLEAKNQQYYYHHYYNGYHINKPSQQSLHHVNRLAGPNGGNDKALVRNSPIPLERNSKVNMLIHEFQVRNEIHGRLAAKNCVFLVLDLEVVNMLEAPYYFRPESARLYIDTPENYGMSLSNIMGEMKGLSQQDMEMDSVYKYSDVTEGLRDGLMSERLIPPHEKIRGPIVFQVPEKVHRFILAHENEFINISISPIKNS